MTHRATELSLGIAAEELYDALPKASRESLGDLPALLQRLQHDAHRLRERYESLNDALSHIGTDANDEHATALREERSVVHERMRETVAALENVRLGLLRLHAGSLTLDGLTTHIGVAADVAAHVDRLVEADAEVAQVLRFPRKLELTPA